MGSPSLTKQAGLLIAGRMLSMPLAFLVPVVLTRKFNVEEFGYYKQLFLIFNVIIPVIDMGITNSLYYFMAKYSEKKNGILLQSIILQIIMCVGFLLCFSIFRDDISRLFTRNETISLYMPLLGLFAISWHLSNILEVVLIIEKRAFAAGVITFTSETARSLSVILVVWLGGGLKALLSALVIVGMIRLMVVAVYLSKKYDLRLELWETKLLKKQLFYAVPFGIAVIINGFVGNIHQYIVSVSASVSDFAVFSIGCFQLPLLGVVVDSVAKTSLVRISELRNEKNSIGKISAIIANACRKLWLLFFPVFVYLFVTAEEFITLLFTTQYVASVPVFRVFIVMIPMSAILVQHVLRAFSETNFILFNNILVLLLSALFCWLGLQLGGIVGIAIGFIVAHLIWKIIFLTRCQNVLSTSLFSLFPIKMLILPTLMAMISGIGVYFIFQLNKLPVIYLFSVSFPLFIFSYILMLYYGNVIDETEKEQFVQYILNIRKKISSFVN